MAHLPDLPGGDLFREWQAATQSLLERERGLQRDLLARAFEPFDAAFDLLEQSGTALREQAEAIEHAARSLEQAAAVMKAQAELFERTTRILREPSRRIEAAVGLAARPPARPRTG
jgi:ABC-type transporter Mla subunit MlaD